MITNHKYEGLRGVFFVQTGRDTHSRMAMARWRFQKMILTHVFLKGGANLHYRFDAEPYQTLCLRKLLSAQDALAFLPTGYRISLA